MDYRHDPNRYHYPPPPPANPNLPPPYPGGHTPYPSLHPTGSFNSHHYPAAAPPPAPYHGHSSSFSYCTPPPPPTYSQPPPPYSPYPLYASYPHYSPPYPLDRPSTSSHDSSPGSRHDSFQYQDMRFPPPHSDAFLNAYGIHEGFGPPPPASGPFSPNSSCSSSPAFRPTAPFQSSSPPAASGYPLESLLSDMTLNDHQRPPPVSTPSAASLSHSSSLSFDLYRPNPGGIYRFPNHSFSGAIAPQTPPSPSSHWPQQPTHGHSVSLGGLPLSNLVNSSPKSPNQIVPFQASLKVLLLHGNLDIMIYEAHNLPNMDLIAKAFSDVMGWRVTGKINNKLEEHNMSSITSDPYVSFSIAGAVLGRTYVIKNSENPVWNQHFYVPVAHYAAEVHFTVKDNDFFGSELIGKVVIPAEHIYAGERVEGTFPIKGSQCRSESTLKLSIQYIPMERLSMYHLGVGPGPDYIGVPGTYFPLRKGGRVKLYQDAHVPDGCLPDLRLDNGLRYEHGNCWQDITQAMREARKLIYIAGWSVYHKVRLVRDGLHGSESTDTTLGDLLKSKSQEGVRVLLLVWDDPTSRSILGYQRDGVMQTHDEETRKFFKHSSVQVLLCPRSAGKRHSWMKQKEVGIIYTHHQKTVIVDSDAGYNKRKIIAFVGGLDLCDGRYDTPKHSLFRTLQTVHKDDYHNPTFVGTDIGGPREPWHDLHCRIDGPAAYDVLTNFEDRWVKVSKPRGIKKLKKQEDDLLLKLERIPEILPMDESPYQNDYDPETWHVQIFRSIDSNSVKGFPKDPKDATSKSLVCGKNVLIDMSIHTAYVKAIRAAQHFIYIENQYFLGSSYNWDSYKDLGANNLIPMEIALKIADKIKANERFSAYIVIPMWPEGVPTGLATQRILFWQHKTMQMMYETVYKALVEAGLQDTYEPQDYLNFFCLGTREAVDLNSPIGTPSPANAPNLLAQKNRRFMIYVHSKGMIVDDEYLILGSANINQRSLEGTRDSEIAMGAYQPQYTWARKFDNPCGQIYAYRMSLWAEHVGALEDCFTRPESLECMRRVRNLGELNWRQFAVEEVTEMRGHLLKYPVDVNRKGKVKSLPGCETFPDVGGNICGSFTVLQENLTI